MQHAADDAGVAPAGEQESRALASIQMSDDRNIERVIDHRHVLVERASGQFGGWYRVLTKLARARVGRPQHERPWRKLADTRPHGVAIEQSAGEQYARDANRVDYRLKQRMRSKRLDAARDEQNVTP